MERDLFGGISLALPEAWQQALNHWLEGVLAFSGVSLVLGYGVLVLALPLLLLPTAFPELSRPRDALWSLVLMALAPLLLLNRLPVFSGAGFGELVATVLVARLAAEVGQGRWGALTPDQRVALRHLPRWRSAGADLVAAVVQAAKAAWRATAEKSQSAWRAVSGSPTPVEQRQPGPPARKPVVRKQWVRPDASDSDGAQVDPDPEEAQTSPEIPAAAPEAGADAPPAEAAAPGPAEPEQLVAEATGEDAGTGDGPTPPKQEQPAEGHQTAEPLPGDGGDQGADEGAAAAPSAPADGVAGEDSNQGADPDPGEGGEGVVADKDKDAAAPAEAPQEAVDSPAAEDEPPRPTGGGDPVNPGPSGEEDGVIRLSSFHEVDDAVQNPPNWSTG